MSNNTFCFEFGHVGLLHIYIYIYTYEEYSSYFYGEIQSFFISLSTENSDSDLMTLKFFEPSFHLQTLHSPSVSLSIAASQ